MPGLTICAAAWEEIAAGTPAVVITTGTTLPDLRPLLVLSVRDGVLARPGDAPARTLPLPPDLPLLALIGTEAEAAEILPLLPAAVPVLPDAALLPALLAEALHAASRDRDAARAEATRLRRALGAAPPRPERVLDMPPIGAAAAAPPASQPLGRPASGICTVELHLAAPGTGGLHVRLLAAERILGSWRVPEAARHSGWLTLDLPEPAAEDPAEALLEVIAESETAPPLLSLATAQPRAGLALRLWTAGPGWSVLPRHFDWAAMGALRPSLPLPVPASLLAEAVPQGARAELVAAGEEPPRLLLEVPAEAEILLSLPALPVGPADLLRLRLLQRDGTEGLIEAALGLGAGQAGTGWRPIGARGELALPLAAGGMAAPCLALRNRGTRPALLEVESLALVAGAAGEKRVAPAAEFGAGRHAVAVPMGLSLPAWRAPTPAPKAPQSEPGGAARHAVAAPRPPPAATPAPAPLPAGATGFQDFRLNQHLDNGEAGYRHMDVAIAGLVSAGGLWRQIRLKLFERRGVAGLEFRQARGWPAMFESWPQGGKDPHGPFWRLETKGTVPALAALVTPHDRALVAALVEVLPEIAGRASRAAKLAGEDAALWMTLARGIADAVAAAREINRPA